MEIWKQINDYPNYEVSNIGNVRNCKFKKLLKLHISNGYYRVTLPKKKKFMVHRLVATAFITNVNNKPQVNHKNDIRIDNNYKNLYWGTQLENMNDRNTRKGWSGGRKKTLS